MKSHLPLAKTMRSNMTRAERELWSQLRAHRLAGHKFKRQVPIGPYIVDFLCFEAGLIIELDGAQHAFQEERDEERTALLNHLGYRVLRFSNPDVLIRPEAVLGTVLGALVTGVPAIGSS